MKAEIIAVGTELLMGETVNTNATWLSQQLATIGVDVYYHAVVGDNPERLTGVLEKVAKRANVLVFTGGLGPTDDDLTVATIARYFDTPLESDPESEQRIRAFFEARQIPMANQNIKQALRPVGSRPITNPMGTAPGLCWDVSDRLGKPTYILCFPGVPKELYVMWPEAKGFLQRKAQEAGFSPTVLVSHSLKFFGIGESLLGETLGDLMSQASPSVAPYVGHAEVRVRIAAKGSTAEEAERLLIPVREEILKRCGRFYFGEGETTLEQAVAQELFQRSATVAVAESCTGGLVSSRLTDVPGSSAYTRLNVVTYSNEDKIQTLGVPSETLSACGAVSLDVALAMARGIQAHTGCDYGLSLTGIAGPDGGTDEKPVGLVYIGVMGPGWDEPIVKRVLVNRNYSRADIKYWFSQYALHYLRWAIQGQLHGEGDPPDTMFMPRSAAPSVAPAP